MIWETHFFFESSYTFAYVHGSSVVDAPLYCQSFSWFCWFFAGNSDKIPGNLTEMHGPRVDNATHRPFYVWNPRKSWHFDTNSCYIVKHPFVHLSSILLSILLFFTFRVCSETFFLLLVHFCTVSWAQVINMRNLAHFNGRNDQNNVQKYFWLTQKFDNWSFRVSNGLWVSCNCETEHALCKLPPLKCYKSCVSGDLSQKNIWTNNYRLTSCVMAMELRVSTFVCVYAQNSRRSWDRRTAPHKTKNTNNKKGL